MYTFSSIGDYRIPKKWKKCTHSATKVKGLGIRLSGSGFRVAGVQVNSILVQGSWSRITGNIGKGLSGLLLARFKIEPLQGLD